MDEIKRVDRPTLDPRTQQNYKRYEARYLAAASKAAMDPDHPDIDWLVLWLYSVAETVSQRTAQVFISALPHYFQRKGLPNPLEDSRAIAGLLTPSLLSQNSSMSSLAPLEHAAPLLQRVGFYYSSASAPGTKKIQARIAGSWEVFARQRNIDPTLPRPVDVASFLTLQSETKSSATVVKSYRYGLRHYFLCCNTPDVTSTPLVQQVLQGMKRARPPADKPPLYIEEVRALVSGLTRRELDVRGRLIIILLYFGGMTATTLTRLDRSRCNIGATETTFGPVNDFRKVARLGHVDDPAFDLRIWLPLWLGIVGTDPGPLFPRPQGRRYTNEPMTPHGLRRMANEIAARSGVTPDHIGNRLRKGYAIKGVRRLGIVATAHQLGYRTLSSLEAYEPFVHAVAEKLKLQSGGDPTRFKRRRSESK